MVVEMIGKKAEMNYFFVSLVFIAFCTVVIIIMMSTGIINQNDLFFWTLESKQQCPVTGKSLAEYKMELNDLFEEKDVPKEDIIEYCSELKSCFPGEYISFKGRCESIETKTESTT